MPDNFQNQSPQPLDDRHPSGRFKSTSTLMLVFAILNSVTLVMIFFNWNIASLLSLATFIMAITLLIMAPRGYKVGFASLLGIIADVLLIIATIFVIIQGVELAKANPGIESNPLAFTNGGALKVSDQAAGMGVLSTAAIILSELSRVACMAFSYFSFAVLRKGSDQTRRNA